MIKGVEANAIAPFHVGAYTFTSKARVGKFHVDLKAFYFFSALSMLRLSMKRPVIARRSRSTQVIRNMIASTRFIAATTRTHPSPAGPS